MAKLLKAMKRPAALWGVPMVPLLAVTGVTIIVAVWTSVALLFLLPVEFLVMKSLTRNEPMRFNLIAVWLRVKGKPVANRLFGATTLMPVEHEANSCKVLGSGYFCKYPGEAHNILLFFVNKCAI